MRVTVRRTISVGHRLPSYKGICSSPHGHNATFVATIRAAAFLDFKEISDLLGTILEPLDHAMVLEREDPLIAVLKEHGWRHVVLTSEPTTEAMAQYVFNELVGKLTRPDLTLISVIMHETEKYNAEAVHPDASVQRIV